MRWHIAVGHGEIGHIEHVAHLVFGARGGPRGLGVGLHGKSAEQQTLYELLYGVLVATPCALGVGERAVQSVLHDAPRQRVYLLVAYHVGHYPVGSSRNLGEEVAVARGGHGFGGAGYDVDIGHHSLGSGAGEGLLLAVLGYRCARRYISVHRGGCRHYHVGALLMGRAELGGVVDGARAHGYCHGVGLSQHGIQAVYVFPFGVHLGLVENIRFAGGDAIAGEDFGYLGSSHVPCGLVGDDDGLAAGKLLGEDITHGAYHATSQLQGLGGGSIVQCHCYSVFHICLVLV